STTRFRSDVLAIIPRTKREQPTTRRTTTMKVYCRRRLTLPHPPRCSTISAGRLSFRVRKGTGRDPTAKTTDKHNRTTHTQQHPQGAWCAVSFQTLHNRREHFILIMKFTLCVLHTTNPKASVWFVTLR